MTYSRGSGRDLGSTTSFSRRKAQTMNSRGRHEVRDTASETMGRSYGLNGGVC